ncbi:hypothetical protein [Microbacterium sp. NPDC089695]|uniref:hypothetical protein n=1 Tax=Microbacterium sp. NPDC089695 TaxID=3364198 RepID=UPI0038250749
MVHLDAYLGSTPEIAHPQRFDRERDPWNLIPIALAIGFFSGSDRRHLLTSIDIPVRGSMTIRQPPTARM